MENISVFIITIFLWGLYLKQDNFKKIMVNIESLGEDWLMLDQVEF